MGVSSGRVVSQGGWFGLAFLEPCPFRTNRNPQCSWDAETQQHTCRNGRCAVITAIGVGAYLVVRPRATSTKPPSRADSARAPKTPTPTPVFANTRLVCAGCAGFVACAA